MSSIIYSFLGISWSIYHCHKSKQVKMVYSFFFPFAYFDNCAPSNSTPMGIISFIKIKESTSQLWLPTIATTELIKAPS